MGVSRYTLCKYVKVAGTWRYCKAAYHDNRKIKPDIVFANVRYGKRNKTRTVEISQRLADAINARRKRLGAGPNDLLFPNGNGNPDRHLLRDLRTLAIGCRYRR